MFNSIKKLFNGLPVVYCPEGKWAFKQVLVRNNSIYFVTLFFTNIKTSESLKTLGSVKITPILSFQNTTVKDILLIIANALRGFRTLCIWIKHVFIWRTVNLSYSPSHPFLDELHPFIPVQRLIYSVEQFYNYVS